MGKDIIIKIHHGGHFVSNSALCYMGGEIKIISDFDPDFLSLVSLQRHIRKLRNYEVVNLYFKFSRRSFSTLSSLKTENDVMYMTDVMVEGDEIELYATHYVERVDFGGALMPPLYLDEDKYDREDNGKKAEGVNVIGDRKEHGFNVESDFYQAGLSDDVLNEQYDLFEQSLRADVRTGRDEAGNEETIDGFTSLHSEDDVSENGNVRVYEDGSEGFSDFSDPEFNLDKDDLFCEVDDLIETRKRVERSLTGMRVHDEASVDINVFEDDGSSDELLTENESSDEEQPVLKNRFPYFNEKTGFCKEIELHKGLQFRNKYVFNKALQYCAVMKGFDFSYITNGTKKVSTQCRTLNCPWRVFASWFKYGNESKSFMIKTWVPHKDCLHRFDNSKVTAKFLTEYYLDQFRINPKWELAAFYAHVKCDLKVNLSNMMCFRARKKALHIIEGSVGEQFKLLRQYCAAILKWCPGSTLKLKTDGGHFQRVYICLDACKRGFLSGCRPIISLDSCHLKGNYNGQIHSAVGRDGNDNMFPNAWAICEAESKDTWTWFLDSLLHDIGNPEKTGWCFISDQQKGLVEALKIIFPQSEHRLCVRHIYANYKKKFKGKELKDALWACARATTAGQFREKMHQLKTLDPAAHSHMVQFDPSVWSRHAFKFFPVCDALCSNISECFNAYIKEAREQPIITSLETIKLLIMKRFQEKYSGMETYGHNIMPRIMKKLTENKESSLSFKVHWNGRGNGFQVARSGWDGHVVDLISHTCDCNLWELTGIPCVHACAAAFYVNDCPDHFVHRFYSKEIFRKVYEASVNPIPGPAEWPNVDGDVILPPLFRKQQGRPKKKRIPEVGERIKSHSIRRGVNKITCSKCKGVGHNKRRCDGVISDPKRAVHGTKESARLVLYRQKKRAAHGDSLNQPNETQPKKAMVKRKFKGKEATHMRENQVSNKNPPIREQICGYGNSDASSRHETLRTQGPVFIGDALFTAPISSHVIHRTSTHNQHGTGSNQ